MLFLEKFILFLQKFIYGLTRGKILSVSAAITVGDGLPHRRILRLWQHEKNGIISYYLEIRSQNTARNKHVNKIEDTIRLTTEGLESLKQLLQTMQTNCVEHGITE